jgi:uncharacterized protein YprB with RNaseH-like and TPR domain
MLENRPKCPRCKGTPRSHNSSWECTKCGKTWKKEYLAPLGKLKKQEIIKLSHNNCEAHNKPYLQHWECYLKEQPNLDRVGVIDIEASNLKADFGIMLCYAIYDFKTNKVISNTIAKKDLYAKGVLDKQLVKQCVADMSKFTKLIGYYSGDYRFDIPFIRTRAVKLDVDFPAYGEIIHQDIYSLIKKKFCLSRNRLETACRNLVGFTRKTYDSEKWLYALQGNQEALLFIQDHCVKDVLDLRDLYLKVDQYGPDCKALM